MLNFELRKSHQTLRILYFHIVLRFVFELFNRIQENQKLLLNAVIKLKV